MIHRILSLVGILVFALGTVVLADPPTVSIQQQATLDQIVDPVFGDVINLGAVVTVVVNCGDGDPSEFQLEVAVRQGDVAGTSGGVFIPSTGGRQVVSVEMNRLLLPLRIPAKTNADSEGNANGIPSRRRTVVGA